MQDDVIKWKHYLRYCPFVWGIHRSPVKSPHKSQWGGALMFYLIGTWTSGWVNNRGAGDFRRHRAHYDVTIMRYANFHCYLPVEMGVIVECNSVRFENKSDFRYVYLSALPMWTIKTCHNGPLLNRTKTNADSISFLRVSMRPVLVCLQATHDSTGAIVYDYFESDIKEWSSMPKLNPAMIDANLSFVCVHVHTVALYAFSCLLIGLRTNMWLALWWWSSFWGLSNNSDFKQAHQRVDF